VCDVVLTRARARTQLAVNARARYTAKVFLEASVKEAGAAPATGKKG
jgi:hypothetical protein